METRLRESFQSVKDVFPISEVYVFGSYARGDERPDSYIDLLVVCYDTPREFERRRSQPWTVEHTARSEGVAV